MPDSKVPEQVKPNQKKQTKSNPKPETTRLVNGMSSGFASGVVTKGQPMSLAEQKAKKAGGIF